MLICLSIGLIAGVINAESVTEKYSNSCIIASIECGKFNVFLFYIKVLLLSSILLIVCFLLSFNYYVYFLNYVAVICVLRFYFSYIFACCIIEGFLSYIMALIFWIPLVIGTMLIYIRFYLGIYFLVFSCNRKYIIPYSCYWPTTRNMLIKSLLYTYLFIFIYAGVFLIILNIIF